MADIFISYKSERRPAARHLAKVLSAYGYDVWYDYGLIPGDDFESRLLAELASAKVVIVLWCTMAVRSEWVTKEAREARSVGKYLPCWIESAKLPEGFESADTITLTEWDGAPRSHMLDRLIGDIARRVGRDPNVHFNRLRELDEDWRGYGAPSLAQFALGRDLTPDAVSQRSPVAGATNILGAPPEGIPPNLLQHWKNALEGDDRALVAIADSYSAGRDLPANDREAARLFALAADKGNVHAQNRLAFMYEEGRGVIQNEAEAARLYSLVADEGEGLDQAFAQTDLGRMYLFGRGLPKDEAEAARLFTLVGDEDGANARIFLGLMYEQGWGVPKDETEAARLFKEVSDGAGAEFIYCVGEDFELGRGVPKDDAVAARLYAFAAEQHDADAMHSLARMYEEGRGVVRNKTEAARLYAVAATQRKADAEFYLGVDHGGGFELGRDAPKDDAKAAQHYARAADLGHAGAQYSLACMYEEGRGVPKNEAYAVRLYSLAADQGHVNAQSELRRIAEKGRSGGERETEGS